MALTLVGAFAAVPLVARRAAPVPVLATVSLALVVAALADVRFTPFVSNAGLPTSIVDANRRGTMLRQSEGVS